MSDGALESMLDDFRAAFPPRLLEVERAFERWGGTYEDAASFRAGAHGKRWDELSVEFLELHREAPLFLNPESVVDVIPAYVAAAVHGGRAVDMLPDFVLLVLTREPSDARFDARFGGLSPVQRDAIRRALEVWERMVASTHNLSRVTAALDSYWLTEGRGA